MKKNRALLYGLGNLAMMVALPLMAQAGTWHALNSRPPIPDIFDPDTGQFLCHGGAAFPLLLTDGCVMVQNVNNHKAHANGNVLKLTPDANGSYRNGTWSQLASIPYIPFAAAQAVLADGRVIIEGGEFTGVYEDFTLTTRARSTIR
jgi:hypothetical protein